MSWRDDYFFSKTKQDMKTVGGQKVVFLILIKLIRSV